MTITPVRPAFASPTAPTPGVAFRSACPPWCLGECVDINDPQGARDHFSDYNGVEAVEFDAGPQQIFVAVSRCDEPDERGRLAPGTTEVHLLTHHGSDYTLTPEKSRRLAAVLTNAANAADTPSFGEGSVQAQHIHIGDQILTEDGWQTVYTITVDGRTDFVAAFTAERDGDATDGWQFTLADPVRVRRPLPLDGDPSGLLKLIREYGQQMDFAGRLTGSGLASASAVYGKAAEQLAEIGSRLEVAR